MDWAYGGPAALRLKTAKTLRELRENAAVPPEQAAVAIGCHKSKISRIERGEAPLKVGEVSILLSLYGMPDGDPGRLALLDDVRATQVLPWWHEYRDLIRPSAQTYLSLEADANHVRCWSPYTVPELLQTGAYAAALAAHSGPLQTARQRAFLEARQKSGAAAGRALWAVIDESALMRQVGSPEIMRDQLSALIRAAGEPATTIQVLPLAAGAVSDAATGFTLLRFNAALPDIAYVERPDTGICLDKEQDVELYRGLADGFLLTAAPSVRTPDILAAMRDRLR